MRCIRGVFLLGVTPAYAYDRWELISPAVVVFVPFGAALWLEAAGDPEQADLISPLGSTSSGESRYSLSRCWRAVSNAPSGDAGLEPAPQPAKADSAGRERVVRSTGNVQRRDGKLE